MGLTILIIVLIIYAFFKGPKKERKKTWLNTRHGKWEEEKRKQVIEETLEHLMRRKK